MRSYKLGVLDDSGIAEEIVFGTLKTHDMEQCREMLKNTTCFHENDILIVYDTLRIPEKSVGIPRKKRRKFPK